ncbi:MAG: N-acetylglucosaminyldiphosphoundecaprenol N-acetyl-beta-D-mannosaminyltransferase [Verrucomicrobiota bacterium]|jgi:N-acetylglucosaminyldiphosphoundecaprenol N-acetyl-beta-D-mannosaminyltransferase|nr:N-acetylglucosaminyldiphosphoundecaprenol N-acetyl-beta-D-mannosaminyltransferase [Verrucomicrobiota bacterium]
MKYKPDNQVASVAVIRLPIHVVTYESALRRCLELNQRNKPFAVSAANTHIAAAARRNPAFGRIMAAFDLILPDGMPLVWMMNRTLRKRKKATLSERVYGPYFMKYAIENAPAGTTHFFFGGSQDCLSELQASLRKLRPDLSIAGTCSPPYRQWNEEDHKNFSDRINEAAADFVWVALGGEKQERWIIENLHRFKRGGFFAVGDAFELLAGRRSFAPKWCQHYGITWLYRLMQEPRRMWKRYFKYNSLFIAYLLKDFLFPRLGEGRGCMDSAVHPEEHLSRINILGVGINKTSLQQAVETLISARRHGERGYVCVTGVHGVMESQRDETLRRIHNRSLMTVPDGMPNVWIGKLHGLARMGRVYGPDLMLELCAATSGAAGSSLTAEKKGGSHFLYGSTEETLRKLKMNLEKRFPGIQIAGMYAPPFRPLTAEEEVELQRRVAACRPDFFWVGLSTPKQEKFMAAHAPLVQGEPVPDSGFDRFPLEAGIMLGVGAAFDIHAGNYRDAPKWIKNSGMQWFYRLCKEPHRLWRRYLWIVPSFLWLFFLQVTRLRKFDMEK